MVSNQPPPFPAFVGANPLTADGHPSDQAIADDAEEAALAGGVSGLDEEFDRLTPRQPQPDSSAG